MPRLSPIESEFATTQEAEAHGRWFVARVQSVLKDPRPGIPHDDVMAEVDAIVADAEKKRRSG